MKLARKLSFALFLGVLGVLAADAYFGLQREVALFDDDVRGDHRRMGNFLRPALAETWRRDGQDRVLELVRLTDAARERINLRWVWLGSTERSEHDALLPVSDLEPLRTNQLVQVTREVPALGEGDFLVSYIPVLVDRDRVGVLEIGESLAPKAAYLRTTLITSVITTLAIAIVCGAVAMAIGRWLVGRPVTLLIDKARRVGSGDLTGPLELAGKDELGDLAGEVNLMCDRLTTALGQLQHADRLSTIGTLTSAIAHEIGTPLNVLSGHARLIARGRVSGADARNSANVMVEQCTRMTNIVRQVLDYGRRREPKKTRADVIAVARSTIQLLEPLAAKNGVRVELSAPDDVRAETQIDSGQIQQALTNLIMNAMQASTDGQTVRVSIDASTRVADSEAPNGVWHRVTIDDSGSGMSEEVRDHIFEPFFTTKEVGHGTGLGLSIAREIVSEHGGFIVVSSELGTGSRFAVHLPAETA